MRDVLLKTPIMYGIKYGKHKIFWGKKCFMYIVKFAWKTLISLIFCAGRQRKSARARARSHDIRVSTLCDTPHTLNIRIDCWSHACLAYQTPLESVNSQSMTTTRNNYKVSQLSTIVFIIRHIS